MFSSLGNLNSVTTDRINALISVSMMDVPEQNIHQLIDYSRDSMVKFKRDFFKKGFGK